MSDGRVGLMLRRAVVVIVVMGVCVASAWWVTRNETPVYRATTTLLVRPNSRVEGTSEVLRSLDTLERRTVIATIARLADSDRTRASVAKRLGVEPNELRAYRIRGSVVPSTNLIQIEVRGPDRKRATAVAQAAVSKTRREAVRMYRLYSLETIEKPYASSRPVHPDPERSYVTAAVLGLFLGLGAALLLDRILRPRGARKGAAETGDGRAAS